MPLPPGGGHVQFEHVTLSYDGGAPALDGRRPRRAPGETVAIVGPTGSGKTTLVAAIARLYDVTRGASRSTASTCASSTWRSCGTRSRWSPTTASCSPRRVRENIAYARPEAAARRGARTPHGGLRSTPSSRRLPDGYDTLVGERGLTLSGGQRQRIAIARAIVADPRVLILDDATASVDAATEREIKRALSEVMGAARLS